MAVSSCCKASGFELVFDESSPEPQASAAPVPIIGTPPQGTTDEGLACSESPGEGQFAP